MRRLAGVRPLWLRLGRDVGILLAVGWVIVVATGVMGQLQPGFDAHAYWLARPPDMYAHSGIATTDAYVYSPAFAQVLSPLTALPWLAFDAVWSAIVVGAYLWLTGPLALPLVFLFPVLFELHLGNVHILLAAMIVFAERWPAVWAFGIMTKLTPGIGLIWYAVRREWRALSLAALVTTAVTLASYLLAPGEWRQWLELLTSSSAVVPPTPYLPIPLVPRIGAAALLIAWGARRGSRWVLPVGVLIALPIVWINSLTVLLALVPELRRRFGLDPLRVPRSVVTRAPA